MYYLLYVNGHYIVRYNKKSTKKEKLSGRSYIIATNNKYIV